MVKTNLLVGGLVEDLADGGIKVLQKSLVNGHLCVNSAVDLPSPGLQVAYMYLFSVAMKTPLKQCKPSEVNFGYLFEHSLCHHSIHALKMD